ncbi:MAG: hypothetical protein KJO05_10005 [Bacteroidia bacterium]|nr:hypothetical protein [Bacteroidia bacterium]MBT8275339.1 hypothetical protein [Bacteroidia bacterium]NNJ82288.1 hypothetical protein [Flavobacteriaceae bacterium]NNM09620.1 hypothetical protein [Flavobacteriaceae bacterium]
MRNLIILSTVVSMAIACKMDSSESSTGDITVVPIDNPIEGNSSLPRLYSSGEEVYLSLVTRTDSMNILRFVTYKDSKWNAIQGVAKGSDWFVNWADFPVISKNEDRLVLTYLQKSDTATYAYDIKVIHRMPVDRENIAFGPAGFLEEKIFTLHDDSTKTEHGFASIVPYAEKSFFVTWLDGRNTAGSNQDDHSDHGSGAMTIRGAVIDSIGEITREVELDARVCDCCQTSATITDNGPLVAYRDRTEEEIRDISVVRQVNGEWLEPQTIGHDNWNIAGCPVNGPSVDANKNTVGLAWFTATKGEGEVNVSFSVDNGATFQSPIRLDSGNATGRVDIVMLSATEAAVLWIEPDGKDEVIQLVKITSAGNKGAVVTVAKTSAERSSGFPQIEKFGDRLMMAWTEVSGETSAIKTATLSLDKL